MTNPSYHLLNFVAVGGVSGWTLPFWCHMFALTLTGVVREWLENLPDGQIKSWNDLVAKFSQHFSHQKKHTHDPSEILDVVMCDSDSIEDFISRFNDESLNIGGISEDMLRGAFRKNVRSNTLIRCLTGKDGMLKAWDDIMSAAKLFARTEKTLGSKSPKQTPKVEFQNPQPNRQAKGTIWSGLQPVADNSKKFDARSMIGGRVSGYKRQQLDDEEWKNEPAIFPRVKGGPCSKSQLIITALVGHYHSQYVFFDTGSTSDIMYEQCFKQLDEEDKARLKPIHAPVSGFGYEVMHP
ncbi:uncharacterized protein LOC143617399 [Bidens hawaiensis]|uniref:uncharacterized protein LOC143617399 n=1 Tax=Bidens hawaiensis TaxID=980011 RepID=UPI00404ACA5E